MGRVASAMLLMAGSGCAQLFGVEQTSAAPDASPSLVSLQIQRFEIGAAIVRLPEDVTNLTATYLIPDDTDPSGLRKVPAVVGASTDTWTAAIPDGTPAIEFTLPDDLPVTFRRQYAFPQRNLLGLYGIFEHPDPQPPAATSILDVHVTLPAGAPLAAVDGFQIYAVGPWYYHAMSATELPAVGGTAIGPVNLPYTSTPTTFATIASRPLAAITMDDRVLALRYNGNDLVGVAEFPQFTQSSATDTLDATMTANPHTALDVQIDPPTVAARLSATNPAGMAFNMQWQVNAAPGYATANVAGPLLQAVAVLPTDPVETITTPVGNPFTAHDWRSVFLWSANKYRTYAVPSMANMTMNMYSGLNHTAEVAPGLVMDDPAPLPVLVSIDDMPLTTDGKVIPLDPAKAVTLSLVADGPGALFYQFNVYELVPAVPATTALTTQTIYAASSTTPMVTLPNDVFSPGHVYMIRAQCITGGYPSFAEGDLWNRSLPYSVGFFDAGIFTVTNP